LWLLFGKNAPVANLEQSRCRGYDPVADDGGQMGKSGAEPKAKTAVVGAFWQR
jgi:hypothetical protein